MKFTISDCMSRINQALNYPAISYEDVSHFFDQAIAELNTSLRIALPTVTEMRLENTINLAKSPNTIILNSPPTGQEIPPVSYVPTVEIEGTVAVYFEGNAEARRSFYIWKNGSWIPVNNLYGIVSGHPLAYEAVPVTNKTAVWCEVPLEKVLEFSITDYLTSDWIILFLIPYVCFKFSVRNGDNGALFSDEFTQGFQQLQTSYNVPNTVTLNTVAHRPAYREIAKENLNDLRKKVPTRAIYDDMRIPNGVRAVYGANIFDNGGWGI